MGAKKQLINEQKQVSQACMIISIILLFAFVTNYITAMEERWISLPT